MLIRKRHEHTEMHVLKRVLGKFTDEACKSQKPHNNCSTSGVCERILGRTAPSCTSGMKCEVKEAAGYLSQVILHAGSQGLSVPATVRPHSCPPSWGDVPRCCRTQRNSELSCAHVQKAGLGQHLSLPGSGVRAQPVLIDTVCPVIGRGPTPHCKLFHQQLSTGGGGEGSLCSGQVTIQAAGSDVDTLGFPSLAPVLHSSFGLWVLQMTGAPKE